MAAMGPIEQLLGPTLLPATGVDVVPTSAALSGSAFALIYFSASWCPPCKMFTPQLAAWAARHRAAHSFKTVFASNDRSEAEFKPYFHHTEADFAIPFGSPLISKLGKQFKVQGIPTLVVVNIQTGEMITSKGREGVSSDPEATGFPWAPQTVWELLEGSKGFLGGTIDTLRSASVVGLYFSAHWCPPCKLFTPELVKWYQATAAAAGKGSLEMVFVSSDKSAAEFNDYFASMPKFHALAYEDRATKAALSDLFDVEGIPTLVFIHRDGSVLTKNGREKVSADPNGFPWPRKPVDSLAAATEYINDVPTAILFTDCMTDAAQEAEALAAFATVAEEHFASDAIRFAHAADGDEAVPAVRQFLGADHMKDKNGPAAARVTLVDVQEGKKVMLEGGALGVPKQDALRALVKAVLEGTATASALR